MIQYSHLHHVFALELPTGRSERNTTINLRARYQDLPWPSQYRVKMVRSLWITRFLAHMAEPRLNVAVPYDITAE